MEDPDATAGGRPFVRLARAVLLLALLCGPLVAAELWARRQFTLLYPHLTDRLQWAEAKLWLVERGPCPDVLALGSSVTNRIWTSEQLVGQTLRFPDRPVRVERSFAFGLDGARAGMLYGAWRQIKQGGCTPAVLAVEVLPGIVNGHQPWLGYYLPLVDARTLWSLPPGFAATVGVDTTVLFNLVTWQRLTLYRLRGAFREALVERVGLRPASGSDLPPALDGVIEPVSDATLVGARFEEERERRRAMEARGLYAFTLSEFDLATLAALVEEARADGSRVILHTPPVTSLYREAVARWLGPQGGFRAVRDALGSRLGEDPPASAGAVAGSLAWYWCYEGGGYGPADFEDWVHLNRRGSGRYVRGLLAALGPDGALSDACRGHP